MPEPSEQSRDRILSEQLLSELKTVREYVSRMPVIENKVDALAEDMTEVKADVKMIKNIVGDHSERITSLEGQTDSS